MKLPYLLYFYILDFLFEVNFSQSKQSTRYSTVDFHSRKMMTNNLVIVLVDNHMIAIRKQRYLSHILYKKTTLASIQCASPLSITE